MVVFFGLSESEERDILEDIENAGIMKCKIQEDSWEIEECHYTVCHPNNLFYILHSDRAIQHDPYIAYPRIYNYFFSELIPLLMILTINSLQIPVALAQPLHRARLSTIHTSRSLRETNGQIVLSSPLTMSIPRQLAVTGVLKLRRHESRRLQADGPVLQAAPRREPRVQRAQCSRTLLE